MKKLKLIVMIICSTLFLQCSSNKTKVTNKCIENLTFRKAFMSNIENIETYMSGKGNRKQFDDGLTFISKYVHVSYEEMMNFTNTYTTFSIFKNDKENWLKWYENNKCNDIQFK